MGDIANMVSEPMDIVTGTSIPGARSTLQNVMGLPIIQPTASRNLTVILELDRMQLGKAVYKLNNEETQRVGVKLAGGFV
jgi:hypothetical protein